MKPEITIVFLTWPNHPARWSYFMQCIPRALKDVTASRHKLHFKCVSESEIDPLHNWYGTHLQEFCKNAGIPLSFRGGPASLGAGMNSAIRASDTEYTIIFQDDWHLEEPLDLSDGIDYMERNLNVDLLRYSWPGMERVTVDGEIDGLRKLDTKGSWPYGDDPHIRRNNFCSKFGWYTEGDFHGTSENSMLQSIRDNKAVIVLADKLYFGHRGAVCAVINDLRVRGVER